MYDDDDVGLCRLLVYSLGEGQLAGCGGPSDPHLPRADDGGYSRGQLSLALG